MGQTNTKIQIDLERGRMRERKRTKAQKFDLPIDMEVVLFSSFLQMKFITLFTSIFFGFVLFLDEIFA